MPKTEDLLLILSPEERDAAEEFVQRRLMLLDADSLPQLELIGKTARDTLEKVGHDIDRIDSSSKTGKFLIRIYQSAQQGLAHLVRQCGLTAAQMKKEAPIPSEEATSAEPLDADKLQIEIDSEDEEYALTVIDSAIADLDASKIRELRNATEELLTWWQTDGGMHQSLHIDQWGDVNTALGRRAIRSAREENQRSEVDPFRGFFQKINLIYQKKNQEIQRQMRQKDLREVAGLTEE